MNEPLRTLGEVVEERLDELEMSARELARKMGLSQTPIYYWLRGIKQPSLSQMKEMARYLEIPPETFIEYRLEILRERLNWRPPHNGQEPKRVRLKRLADAEAELARLSADLGTPARGSGQARSR